MPPSGGAWFRQMAVSSFQAVHEEVLMSMTAVIGFGIFAWILVAVLLAFGVARVIKLRDRQRPHPVEPETPAQDDPSSGAVRSRPGRR